MSAWGAAAKSCDALLKRVEENDVKLTELVILPIKIFGDVEVERLAKALPSNTHLESLSASGHFISVEGLRILGKALKESTPTFTRLAVGKDDMGDDGVAALLEAGGGHLKVLDLAYKSLGVSGIEALPNGCSALQELNLSRNAGISNAGLAALSKIGLPNLHTLLLSECQIGAPGVEALAKTNCLPCLKVLSLSNNPLGAASGEFLATIVANLDTVNLASCGIGNDGASALSSTTSSTCKDMDLSDNDIGPAGALSPSAWPDLKDLKIAKNPLEGVTALLELKKLESLDASETNCGPEGAASLVQSKTLKRLRLFNNELGAAGFEALAAVLPDSTLIGLDLGGNRATEASVIDLLNALRAPTTLQVLELGGNESTDRTHEIIKEIQAIHPDLDIAKDRPSVTGGG